MMVNKQATPAHSRNILAAIAVLCLSIGTACTAARDLQRSGVEDSWQRARQMLALGNLQEAEQVLRDAALRAAGDREKAGTALLLGVVLNAAGDGVQAGTQLDAAAALVDSLAPAERVELLLARGSVAARDGDFALAEQRFDTAAEAARSSGLEAQAVRADINALRARLDRRELAGLDGRLARVHAAVLRLSGNDETALLLIADGELQRRAVNEFASSPALRKAAYESFERARSVVRARVVAAQAVGFLGALYEDEGRWDEALRLTSRAVFLAQASGDAEQLYRWEWQLARIERRQDKLAESIASMDRAMNGLAEVRNDVMKSSRQAFGSLIEPVYLDYADISLRRAAAMADGSEEQQRVLRGVRNQLESLKQAEVQDYFANACAAGDASALDQGFRIAGTAVIYPILLPDRIEVLAETDGTLRRFSAPVSRGQATFTTRQLRLALERIGGGDAYLAPAQSLYQWLIATAEPWLAARGVNTIVFVPSGALRTIPLGALHDGERFLIQKYAVATTPAVSLVTSARSAPIERILLGGLTKGVQGFAGLPGVEQEMRTVSSLFPTQSMQDESFQLSSVRTQLSAPEYSVAHLATHGEFSSDYRQSFVLTYDNRLTMADLRSVLESRRAPLDLLVLSACQTAAGDDRAALGLAGVAIQAGARSALASLWSISDAATAALMATFYENSKLPGATKAHSLQQAQIQLLESAQFGHPGYWAPYLMIGNWM